MGMMAAINIIFSLVSAFVPYIAIFLVLVFPLTSTVVELYCKDRYYPIYAFATIGLALVVTLWNMESTIFYLVPSILTGYIFGLLSKKNIPSIWAIFISSVIQMGVSLAFIPLIYFLFQVDIVVTFETFFALQNSTNIGVIIPAFIFAVSTIQMALSYVIISGEIKKFGFAENDNEKYQWIYQLVLLVALLAMLGFAFFSLETAYVLLLVSIYFACFIVADYIKAHYWHILIVFSIGLIANVITFGIYYENMPSLTGLLLIGITPFWIAFISLIVSFLKRRPKKIE